MTKGELETLIGLTINTDRGTIAAPTREELTDNDHFECVNAGTIDRWWRTLAVELAVRAEKLVDAVKKHRDQKADDLCIFDDDELYAVFGDGVRRDPRVGNQLEMAANCIRFIRNRTEGGGPWCSYAELEKKLNRALQIAEEVITKATNALDPDNDSEDETIVLADALVEIREDARKLLKEKTDAK